MPETPDLKALAERYLDLWEEQFAAAADPALAAAMAAWMGPWRALARGAGAAGKAGLKAHDTGAVKSARARAAAATMAAAGSTPAGAASGDGGGGLDRIAERLERIERRLDALERKRAGKGRSAGAGTRGGRSRRTG